MSTISVIIPAYNAEKFIGEAIESALNQTRPAREIVVVDDASTDRTVEIARGYGDRVQVLVNNVNSGPGYSRNAGVAASTGDYLAFLDADDKWLPEHLEDLGGLLDKWPEAGFAAGAVRTFGSCKYEREYFPEATSPRNIFIELMRSYGIWPSAVMVRRKAYDGVGGFVDVHEYCRGRRIQTEDWDFMLNVAIHSSFVSSPRISALFRKHPDQSTFNQDQHRLSVFKCKSRMIARLENKGRSPVLIHSAVDRLQREFEQHLRDARRQLNLRKIRAFVRWGNKNKNLKSACKPYLWSMWCPGWMLRIRDLMRRRE